MAIDRNNVAFMTEYLKYAVTFEKNFHIWSHAMKDINGRMQRLYSDRTRLMESQRSAKNALTAIYQAPPTLTMTNRDETALHNKRAKKSLTAAFAAMLIFLGIGCMIGLALISSVEELAVPQEFVIPIMGIACMLIGSLFTGIVPLCLLNYFREKSKAKNPQSEAKNAAAVASAERRKQLLQAQVDDTEKGLFVNSLEESRMNTQQDEIHKQLQIAKNNLAQIYSLNVLPEKYRDLNAVATFYEYLSTGRCNTIQGHGGIYDTYETERIQLAQLAQQIQMNATLDRIEDSQRQICRELQQVNSTLVGIRSHLNEIEKTNAEIAHNTAISAAANQQTAAAAQYLAWKARY